MSAYVDEHVEARYEEIINHLHKALSSTEQDEQDFKVYCERTKVSRFVDFASVLHNLRCVVCLVITRKAPSPFLGAAQPRLRHGCASTGGPPYSPRVIT